MFAKSGTRTLAPDLRSFLSSKIERAGTHDMGTNHRIRSLVKWSLGAIGFAAGASATHVGVQWIRYGYPRPANQEDADDLLDRFMPEYEVTERHHVQVGAPADITFTAACHADLMRSPIVRAIFKARELILGSEPDRTERPRGLLAWTKSLGWGVLAEVPGREVVMGAITQPWAANVVFHPLPPGDFLSFHEPGFVKIAWTLRADPSGPEASIFRTETRVSTTDRRARSKFRWYWSFLSPGIVAIRWLSLGATRADAERRAASLQSPSEAPNGPVN
jgi:hypothetical protein